MKVTMPQKIGVGCLVAIGLVLFLGGHAHHRTGEQNASAKWVAHTYQVIAHLGRLQELLADIETGARGFYLTGQPDDLDRFESAAKRSRGELRVLRALTVDNSRQQSRWTVVEPFLVERIALARELVQLAQAGRTNAVRLSLEKEQLRYLRNSLRESLSEALAEEEDLLAGRVASAEAQMRLSNRTTGAWTLTTVALLLLGSWILLQDNRRRTQAEQALRTAHDEMEARVAARTAQLNGANVALQAEIMERQRIEAVLQSSHERLEARVAERTHELADANQGLQREITQRTEAEEEMRRIQQELEGTNRDLHARNQEIQNFYHTLSHELKTPLTSAREFVAIVLDGLAGPLNETQREYLGLARDGCNQIRVCINDLLDATRLETGKLTLDMKQVSLGPLAQRIAASLQSVAHEKSITLAVVVESGLPRLNLDEHRFSQVINNLLTNAIKFTPSGGRVAIAVRSVPSRAGLVELAVSDTGCGISSAEIERIFDRLYQIKTGDATTEQGVGLGLYICRELVSLHGGTIQVESEPGRGSTFRVLLPVPVPAPAAAPISRPAPAPSAPHVLIVDDDPVLCDLLRQILERGAFHVETAGGGRMALNRVREKPPDVVVLDLEMPEMDGAAALEAIRAQCAAIPVIIYTGFPEGEVMNRAAASAPFTLLEKPAPPAHLIEAIRRVLEPGGPKDAPGRAGNDIAFTAA